MKLELYGGFGEGEEPSLKDPNKHYTYTKKCNCCGLEFKTNNPQKREDSAFHSDNVNMVLDLFEGKIIE